MIEAGILTTLCEPILVKEYSKYRVFSDGRIFSIKMRKWLHPSLNINGYMYVRIKNELGEFKGHYVHRLLGICFIPNPNNLPFINHIDGNKLNNSLSNLEWCTCAYNNLHGYKITGRKGPKSNAILTVKMVGKIKYLILEGYRNTEIAKLYGMHKAHISRIRNGHRWGEVSPIKTTTHDN
jgi:hypothetical protein